MGYNAHSFSTVQITMSSTPSSKRSWILLLPCLTLSIALVLATSYSTSEMVSPNVRQGSRMFYNFFKHLLTFFSQNYFDVPGVSYSWQTWKSSQGSIPANAKVGYFLFLLVAGTFGECIIYDTGKRNFSICASC